MVQPCPDCGHVHPVTLPEAEVEATHEEAKADENVAETISSGEVEIARIQADRDVTLAKIERGIIGAEIEASTEENAVKAEILDEVMTPPEPDPVPVVVEEAPAEEPVTEDAPPPVADVPEATGKRKSNPWW